MRHRVIFALIICFALAASVVRMRAPSLTSAASQAQSWILSNVAELSEDVKATPSAAQPTSACDLPQEQKSVRFAVIGDSGTGKTQQYQVGQEMEKCRQTTS